MRTSRLELYEELKQGLGDKAARMLTDALPEAQELATKTELRIEFAQLRAEVAGLEAKLVRWLLGLFIPVWVSTLGTLVAVLFLLVKL